MGKEGGSSQAVWEFLSAVNGDRELVREYQDASTQTFFDDLGQLSQEQARNVLLVMSGRMEEVPPRDYMDLHDKGWVFIEDYDLDNPDKYGRKEDGWPRTGSLVASPNYLMSVSLFDVARFMQSRELYHDFFKNVLGQ